MGYEKQKKKEEKQMVRLHLKYSVSGAAAKILRAVLVRQVEGLSSF